MVRKELHLDEQVIKILEAEARRQNRSLKNYLEHLAIAQAKELEVPPKAYTEMMDDLCYKFDKGQIEFSAIEDVLARYGISDQSL
ncbi:hypothetical protein [Sinomicrobium soli]|uniref:hypothetical protein n=1 Tax=Sinomicrobium sp. N-1-3-6 TaxID=2219864 RepID=UPI000DCE6DAE|nr:hypothetical protein [Sinomicrobium sp. N-1-3-6]RAV31007.1 hypothetical protein DN748_01810 [Sinomicrobium sp. N-1-3-6]